MFFYSLVDLSYKKNAIQSSTRNGPFYAENAVDRNNMTCMRTYPIGPNSPEKATWWKVDLGGLYSIYSVNIQFKIYESYGKKMSVLRQLFLSLCYFVNLSLYFHSDISLTFPY